MVIGKSYFNILKFIFVCYDWNADCDFSVFLLHKPSISIIESEHTFNDKPSKKSKATTKYIGKKNEADINDKGVTGPIECSKEGKIFPDSFGIDKIRVRVKQKASEKLKGSFLPFVMGPHSCKVIFEDKDYGRFCYEFVGEVTLPPVFAEYRFNVAIDGSQVRTPTIQIFLYSDFD